MTESPELGYWAIRGLAQPCRLLLAYTGTDFVDKRYTVTGKRGTLSQKKDPVALNSNIMTKSI